MTAHFKLVKSETVPMTDEVLKAFLALPPSPTERPYKPDRVTRLKNKMLDNTAIPFLWAMAELDGVIYRMNGQHSSRMLEELAEARPADLSVHFDTFKVFTKDGLAVLFRQFDDRGSGRDAADTAGAFQMLEEALVGVNPKIARLAVEGIAWYDWNVLSVRNVVGDDRYALFHVPAYHEFILWCGTVFDIKTREMEAVPVLAAMWGTYTTNTTEAKAFWEKVARGGDIDDDSHPTTRLDEWLKSQKGKDVKKVKAGELYQGCIFAWNAFRKESQIVKIKYEVTKGLSDIIG